MDYSNISEGGEKVESTRFAVGFNVQNERKRGIWNDVKVFGLSY